MLVYFSERLSHILLVKPLEHSYYTASKSLSAASPQAMPGWTRGERNCLTGILRVAVLEYILATRQGRNHKIQDIFPAYL